MSDEMKILKKMITASLSPDDALKISQAIVNLANGENVIVRTEALKLNSQHIGNN